MHFKYYLNIFSNGPLNTFSHTSTYLYIEINLDQAAHCSRLLAAYFGHRTV